MGTYLSKKSEIEVLEILNNGEEHGGQGDEIKELRKLEKKLKVVGIENSCYIPREHGEDISLLAEIVMKQENHDLFKPKDANDKEKGDEKKVSFG